MSDVDYRWQDHPLKPQTAKLMKSVLDLLAQQCSTFAYDRQYAQEVGEPWMKGGEDLQFIAGSQSILVNIFVELQGLMTIMECEDACYIAQMARRREMSVSWGRLYSDLMESREHSPGFSTRNPHQLEHDSGVASAPTSAADAMGYVTVDTPWSDMDMRAAVTRALSSTETKAQTTTKEQVYRSDLIEEYERNVALLLKNNKTEQANNLQDRLEDLRKEAVADAAVADAAAHTATKKEVFFQQAPVFIGDAEGDEAPRRQPQEDDALDNRTTTQKEIEAKFTGTSRYPSHLIRRTYAEKLPSQMFITALYRSYTSASDPLMRYKVKQAKYNFEDPCDEPQYTNMVGEKPAAGDIWPRPKGKFFKDRDRNWDLVDWKSPTQQAYSMALTSCRIPVLPAVPLALARVATNKLDASNANYLARRKGGVYFVLDETSGELLLQQNKEMVDAREGSPKSGEARSAREGTVALYNIPAPGTPPYHTTFTARGLSPAPWRDVSKERPALPHGRLDTCTTVQGVLDKDAVVQQMLPGREYMGWAIVHQNIPHAEFNYLNMRQLMMHMLGLGLQNTGTRNRMIEHLDMCMTYDAKFPGRVKKSGLPHCAWSFDGGKGAPMPGYFGCGGPAGWMIWNTIAMATAMAGHSGDFARILACLPDESVFNANDLLKNCATMPGHLFADRVDPFMWDENFGGNLFNSEGKNAIRGVTGGQGRWYNSVHASVQAYRTEQKEGRSWAGFVNHESWQDVRASWGPGWSFGGDFDAFISARAAKVKQPDRNIAPRATYNRGTHDAASLVEIFNKEADSISEYFERNPDVLGTPGLPSGTRSMDDDFLFETDSPVTVHCTSLNRGDKYIEKYGSAVLMTFFRVCEASGVNSKLITYDP